MDERGQRPLQSDWHKKKVMAKGGKAQQLKQDKGKKICCWKEAMEGWRGQQEWGAWKGEKMKRVEKQGTYFPVYPYLRDAKKLKKPEGRKTEKEKEGK